MANTVDFTSSILKLRSKLTIPLLIATVILSLATWWFWCSWSYLIGAVACFAFAVFINGLYVIMPGYAGYKITLGKMANKSYPAGFGWMIPFISTMTEVDITKQTHRDTNTMKNINRRDITLTYVLTWHVSANAVHTLHATIGENDYVRKALCPQLDACITNIIAGKTYDEINAGLAALSSEVMAAFTFDTMLFKNVELNIVDVKFDKDYEEAVAETAKVEMERKIVEEKAKQLKITADAQAEVIRTKAQAEADALKVKGASENEIREALGTILKDHPELIKETLAKNFPKVFGGSTMVNIDDLLKL